MLEFRILGPLEVARQGSSLKLGGPKQRSVLALLLLGANRMVSVERLAEDLYSGAPPVTAVTQVRSARSARARPRGQGRRARGR
jgi:DNA-binding SARP family transcriptional activator